MTKTIIEKIGQCTHMNSNHVHSCVKHIGKTVHDPFWDFFRLDTPLQKRLGGVAYQYLLIFAKNVKNGQDKASKYVQWSSKKIRNDAYSSGAYFKGGVCPFVQFFWA